MGSIRYLKILKLLKGRITRRSVTNGVELRQAIIGMEYCIHSTVNPKYWSTDAKKIPDLLDFLISRQVSPNFIEIKDNFDLKSVTFIKKYMRPSVVSKTTDWESLRIKIEYTIDLKIQLKTVSQIEEESESLADIIRKAE